MKMLGGALVALMVAWSVLQLIAASGVLPPADAGLGREHHSAAGTQAIDLVRRAYGDCRLMQSLVARFDAGEPVAQLAVIEAAAWCEGRAVER